LIISINKTTCFVKELHKYQLLLHAEELHDKENEYRYPTDTHHRWC
jgi:hypothetical protein